MSSDRRKQYNDEIRAQTARRREYKKAVAVRVTIAFAVVILFASVIVPYLSTRKVAYSMPFALVSARASVYRGRHPSVECEWAPESNRPTG